jgi:hypothetical protein
MNQASNSRHTGDDVKREKLLLGESDDRPLGGEGTIQDSLAQHTPEDLKHLREGAEPLLDD